MAVRILVVDDEPDMLALLRAILRGRPATEVVTTNNPLEVREILAREPFDLVITDLKMPGVDGLDVLAEVQRRDPAILVLVITAYGTPQAAEEAMARGAFDFLTKPFRKEQILLALDKAVRWQAMVRENQRLKQRLESTEDEKGRP
jgi:DNA-binding NtrC family response regulator